MAWFKAALLARYTSFAPLALPAMSQPGTFAANALSAAVCMTNIALLRDPKLDLVNRAHQLGEETLAVLRSRKHPLIGDVRGRGLMVGIELALAPPPPTLEGLAE